ncbi:WYL domain-containing protein [Clostridium algidicarnis]|uniref:WYL domain-containing protein n=1 Tax=Clostridium algidicarnis TaxID=37659 RepID=UPI003FD89574
MQEKKMIPFCIIEFLEKNTDEEHALLPSEILESINTIYGEGTIKKTATLIEHIDNINKFYTSINDGLEIIEIKYDKNSRYKNNKRYFYGQRKFEFAEILFLQNILLNSNALPQKEISDICKKLTSFLSESQKKIIKKEIMTDGSTKTTNRTVYINLETIQNSIALKQNIEFNYLQYNLRKELVNKKREYKYIVSPYGIICSYGSYFLIGYHLPTKMKRTYRIDKIKDIKENLEEGYRDDKSISFSNYVKDSVFMHTDEKKIEVILRCEMPILDSVVERFGNCRLIEDKNNPRYFIATIPRTTYLGIKYWILQFSSACEVIEPKDLRQDIIDTLSKALDRYENT